MPNRGADANEPDFHMLPKNLRVLVKNVGFPQFREMSEDEQHIYDRVRSGQCMTCGNRLADTANFIVSKYGIVGGYCNGVCHTDMAVLGWLQEQHAELSERISFREGKFADTADVEGTAEGDDSETTE